MAKKKWIWGIAAAAVLLTAAVLLLCIPDKKESPKNPGAVFQEYYNNKCQSYSVQNANLAKGQIVFIGDSITDLYILDDHYADLPLASYNRGIGGDTTAGVLDRLQVSIFDIQPSVVVLMIGSNDINGGIDSDEILQRYEAIIDSIYTALPEVDLYCMSIIPQNKDLETYTEIRVDKTTSAILAINPRIQALAESKDAIYLDLFSLLADENNLLIQDYSDDGIHLNNNGLSVWTALLKPYLMDSLAENAA